MQLFLEEAGRRCCRCVVAAVMFAAATVVLPPAFADEPAPYGTPGQPPFNERFPAGTLHSTEDADTALAEAGKEREVIEDQYIDEQRACYKKFFVAVCLEKAKERNRVAVKQVRDVEVEANAYKRQVKADERDKALAEQRVKDEQDAARRAKEQKERDAAAARKIEESAAKQAQVKEREQQSEGQEGMREKEHDAKLRKAQADEAAKAPQRAASEQAYKQKALDAEAHRKDVEQRKADKDRERAAKQQQAPATTPVPAPVPEQTK